MLSHSEAIALYNRQNAQAIRAERLRRGWTQQELAERAGIVQGKVSIAERDGAGPVVRAAIAAAFELDPNDLYPHVTADQIGWLPPEQRAAARRVTA